MKVLIVGAGISGISAAKVLLGAGAEVVIAEKEQTAGGLMARIANCRVGFKTFLDEIAGHPGLTIVTDRQIEGVNRTGQTFAVAFQGGETVEADAVIISAGLKPFEPEGKRGPRVLTSLEYDQIIDQRKQDLPDDFKKIAFVLCVGSRCQEYPLCSSVCCSYTLREIKWTFQRSTPDITVFYNDLRFFGQEFAMEQLYRKAGVRFIRSNSRFFEEDETGVTVRYYHGGEVREERFNYVVQAIGLRPNPSLAELSRLFGFSLNKFGFVQETRPLHTDVPGIYVSGGGLEPVTIKDAIMTGFGAAVAALEAKQKGWTQSLDARLFREAEPESPALPDGATYLFYLVADDHQEKMFYEYVSGRMVAEATALKKAGKSVYFVTRNLVMPSYAEIDYEAARKEGVLFIHLEEDEGLQMNGNTAQISGRDIDLSFDAFISSADYLSPLQNKEFLIKYRSEPQLRWSPTKWGRKRYHFGFIRFPRAARWGAREELGAIGEAFLDLKEERILPSVNDEKCSGCGSCEHACPQHAITVELRELPLAIFGPLAEAVRPVAHVDNESCASCGLCASICPSDAMGFGENGASNDAPAPPSFQCDTHIVGIDR